MHHVERQRDTFGVQPKAMVVDSREEERQASSDGAWRGGCMQTSWVAPGLWCNKCGTRTNGAQTRPQIVPTVWRRVGSSRPRLRRSTWTAASGDAGARSRRLRLGLRRRPGRGPARARQPQPLAARGSPLLRGAVRRAHRPAMPPHAPWPSGALRLPRWARGPGPVLRGGGRLRPVRRAGPRRLARERLGAGAGRCR